MKTLYIVVLFLFVGVFGFIIGGKFGKTEEDKKRNAWIGALIALGTVTGIILLFKYTRKWKATTVNYTLFYKGKRVYDGICFDHRFDARMVEHANAGKIFDKITFDTAKPRHIALQLEKQLIQQHTPKYNIQHNCGY